MKCTKHTHYHLQGKNGSVHISEQHSGNKILPGG